MSKSNKCIICVSIIVLVILFWIDTQDWFLAKFTLNTEFWSSLIGALIGAVVTIYGIYWTLTEEKRKLIEEKKEEKRKSEEDLRNCHRPYLQYWISIGIFPYRIEDQNGRTATKDYEFNNPFSVEDTKELIFPLSVDNIGLGTAFITKIEVLLGNNPLEHVTEGGEGRKKIIKKEDKSVFCVIVKGIRKEDIPNLKLKIYYEDFFSTRYSDTIKVALKDNGDPQSFSLEKTGGDKSDAIAALERYFESYEVNQDKYIEKIKTSIIKGDIIVKKLAFEAMNERIE